MISISIWLRPEKEIGSISDFDTRDTFVLSHRNKQYVLTRYSHYEPRARQTRTLLVSRLLRAWRTIFSPETAALSSSLTTTLSPTEASSPCQCLLPLLIHIEARLTWITHSSLLPLAPVPAEIATNSFYSLEFSSSTLRRPRWSRFVDEQGRSSRHVRIATEWVTPSTYLCKTPLKAGFASV